MDIERLNKVQIVLLTLLISFVTSIATGIVTVSLMDQAPPAVAQTVNRVIERTVQTVVPSAQSGAAAVTQEKTIVVNDSDLIAQAVQKVSPSVVRVFTVDAQAPAFIGLGVVVDASGTVAVDTDSLGENADAVVELPSGDHVRAFVFSRDLSSGIAFLSGATTTKEGSAPVWAPVSISAEHPTLGQTIVALSGNTVARISNGLITALVPASQGTPQLIETSVAENSVMPGSPLIDTGGNLVGISTVVSRASSGSGFVPASVLMKGTVSASDKK
jgi:hypothetical protein